MIRIREAKQDDIAVIVDFQMQMALESEDLKLDRNSLLEGVRAVFLDPRKGRYFVAVENTRIIASLLITPEWSDWRNQWVWWIQSVFVEPACRKQGVFKMMFQHLKILVEDDSNCAGLRLYVDKNNEKAVQVYIALGMDGDHYHTFEWMKN